MWSDQPNIQSLWGALIVEELVRNGVTHFVVCPGSRSTPLVQAVARNPRATATVWVDERGAGFHALGRGRGFDTTAVVTTSGTAVANLLPAVVEASLDGVPLVLLTADRPPELREVGANQSIRQMGIFADHVRWAFDLPTPGTGMPARALLTTVDHAVQRATCGHTGPVQLNCPFREPLAPSSQAWDSTYLDDVEQWMTSHKALTRVLQGHLEGGLYDGIGEVVGEARRGVIVVGTLHGEHELEAVERVADALGWPVWADVRAGLRRRNGLHLDRLIDSLGPDVVLQFGSRLTSKRVQAALSRGAVDHYILVDAEPSRLDPTHQVTTRCVSSIEEWCLQLLSHLEATPAAHPAVDVEADGARIETALDAAIETGDALTEPYVARRLTRMMSPHDGLFLSNSMPIRDVENYRVHDGPEVHAAANRGASGIDGVVSTAAGYAQGLRQPTTLLIGDVALIHDINALAMLGQLEQPLTTVVLNNGGGSIFSFLPIAEHEDVLDPYVATPHGISFEGVCKDFDIPYIRVETRADFERAYREAIASGEHTLIEVASSLEENKREHERIEAAIEEAVTKARD